MKFPELNIKNFLALTEAKIKLSDRGLVLIQGENKADTSANSNGAGKSSIPDALCWCWFGTTARGVSGDEVVNRDAKKDCVVESVVQDGHMTYTATRHRKHKTGKNTFTLKSFDGMKEIDLTKGTEKLTQEVASAIIGCSLEVFSGSIYAGQDEMPDLPAMTDKQLKMLIEEAAGVTVLEAAYKKAREDHGTATTALTEARTNVDKAESQAAFMRSQLVSVKGEVGSWEGLKVFRMDNVKSDINAIVPKLRQLMDDIAAIDPADLEAKIKDCDVKIVAVAAEQTELARLLASASKAESRLRIAESNYTRMQREHASIKIEVDGIVHRVGCPCNECGRPLTPAELADATKAAEGRLTSKHTELMNAESEKEAAEAEFNDAQRERDEYAASMTDISAVSAQRLVFERGLAVYNGLVSQQSVLTSQARTLRDQLLAIQAETNPHEATVKKLETSLTALEDSLVSLRKQVLVEEETVALEAEVVKIYSPAGVRAHVLDDVTPFLNTQSAKYLVTLSDGNIEATWNTLTPDAKGNLKEKFTIDVTNATGGESFKSMSGGEKRKVRIATALALQDLVATRASKPIDLFIGDEIDDALDPAGLERLMMILEEKARERGSVFVISHNELRDHIKQVLLVEKLPNKTTRITEIAA
jgi:DNA repair exonuclease SbcCD ATPase subunit